jgi:hypothetical protein
MAEKEGATQFLKEVKRELQEILSVVRQKG